MIVDTPMKSKSWVISVIVCICILSLFTANANANSFGLEDDDGMNQKQNPDNFGAASPPSDPIPSPDQTDNEFKYGDETEVELVTGMEFSTGKDDDEASKKLKAKTPPIPVFVTEEHHSVLKSWFKAAGDPKKPQDSDIVLPPEDVTVIHIDSHPDMSMPKPFPREIPQDPAELENKQKIDIASFVLAGVWSGLVDHIMWIRPPWSRQLDDQSYTEAYLGYDKNANQKSRFMTSLVDMYWSFNDRSIPAENITEAREWHLSVNTIAPLLEEDAPAPIGPWILDIDEDYFGTYNPEYTKLHEITEQLRIDSNSSTVMPALENLINLWRREYVCMNSSEYMVYDKDGNVESVKYDMIKQGADTVKHTLKQIVTKELYLESVDLFLNETKQLADLFCGDIGRRAMKSLYEAIRASVIDNSVHKNLPPKERKRLIYEMILSVHSSANLPHMPIPTSDTVDKMILDVLMMLRTWARKGSFPSLVTFSRSVTDGFTPLRTWVQVESRLLKGLETIYRPFISIPTKTHDKSMKTVLRMQYDTVDGKPLGRAPPSRVWPKEADGVTTLETGVATGLDNATYTYLLKNKDFRTYHKDLDDNIRELKEMRDGKGESDDDEEDSSGSDDVGGSDGGLDLQKLLPVSDSDAYSGSSGSDSEDDDDDYSD